MNKRILALLLAALLTAGLFGCAKKESFEENPKVDILATTQPVYQLACALTDGTGLTVALLISEPVSCLHDYTLTVSQMEKVEQAALVLESGLGLEDFMEDALRGKTCIDISQTLPVLTGDEGTDPHWWLDPTRILSLPTRFPKIFPRLIKNSKTCRPTARKRLQASPAARL